MILIVFAYSQSTLLHVAASVADSADVMQALLTPLCPVSRATPADDEAHFEPPPEQALTADHFGRLPLHYAAANGHVDSLSFLLNYCRMPTDTVFHADVDGNYALHLALYYVGVLVLLQPAGCRRR